MSFLQTSVSEKASVQVAVRVRPINQREHSTDIIASCNNNNVYLKNPEDRKKKTFGFDYSYDIDASQDNIYENIGNQVVANAFLGYNTCVFAYGQSGSGKTHTMMGSDQDSGLIPRICQALFEKQDSHNDVDIKGATVSYKLELSYLEIYSEEIRDLLIKTPTNLRVREHPEMGPYIESLSQVLVSDYKTIKRLIDQGSKERVSAATLLNSRSSRSHAILTLYFTQLIDEPDIGKTREVVSRINLVDLAGSERVELSGVTGINFKEAININKSLSTLGLVIGKLATHSANMYNHTLKPSKHGDKGSLGMSASSPHKQPIVNGKPLKSSIKKNSPKVSTSPVLMKNPSTRSPVGKIAKTDKPIADHIPFRDSVLTWILKDSLGGNSRTYMIATISPSALNYNESLSTLRYAYNAKQIVNTVKINEDPNDKLIRILKDEIAILRGQLTTKGSDSTSTGEDLRRLKEEISQREDLMREKDKTWEQKMSESKRINEEVQEQLKKEMHQKQAEFHEKLRSINTEKEQMLREMEQMKADLTGAESSKQKQFEEELTRQQQELERKQANFEKDRIVGTAMSLHEYYEKKLKESIAEHEVKVKQESLVELAKLKEHNSKLKDEMSRNQHNLQAQMRQFKNDQVILTKQNQQLHNKIHSLEQELQNKTTIDPSTLPENLQSILSEYNRTKELVTTEESKYASLQSDYTDLTHRIEVNKETLTKLEQKHNEILIDINSKSAELNQLKQEYTNLSDRFASDKLVYDSLICEKESLHTSIIDLKIKLDEQVSVAQEKLKNPTIEDLLRIKDGLAKIFESIKR